jgi:hypothetical protein
MFEDIVRRATRQARQPIILSAADSEDLRQAAALIENAADDCSDERLARSLSHVLDRLNRLIAAGNYHRHRYRSEKAGPNPFEYMTEAELAEELERLENELAGIDEEIAALKANTGDASGQ